MFAANSYVVVTWLPPLELDPFLSFPVSPSSCILSKTGTVINAVTTNEWILCSPKDNIGSKDYILLPAWMPGHWMLCVYCSLHFWVN